MKIPCTRSAIAIIFMILVLFVFAVGLTYRQVRHERLNQSLIFAIIHNDSIGVTKLLKQGADPNSRINMQPRLADNEEGLLGALKDWWNQRRSPYRRTSTALRFAIVQGNRKVVQILLDRGADPNARSGNDNITELMTACESLKAQKEIMQNLLKYGANVNARNASGETPLIITVTSMFGNASKLRILLDNGADVNAVDNHGNSALMWAAASDDERGRTVSLLLERGADAHYRLNTGETALSVAIRAKNAMVIRLLKRAIEVRHVKY